MGHRVIRGLKWALPVSRPDFQPRYARKGAKGRGVAYEKALGKELGAEWTRGQWFEFLDDDGKGWCQVDFFHRTADATIVLESKLSWVPEAHTQLELLYRPVVEMAWKKPMIGLVVTRRLVPGCTGAIAHTLPSAIKAAASCRNVVLHWSGKGPLILRPHSAQPRGIPLTPLPATP